MGQAKRRGTYEQRVDQAQLAQQIIEKAFPNVEKRLKILRHYDNDVRKLANEIIQRQKGVSGQEDGAKAQSGLAQHGSPLSGASA